MRPITTYPFFGIRSSGISILCLCLLLCACKKSEVEPKDYQYYVFGSSGKDFAFTQYLKVNGEYRQVIINVPQGTTNTDQSIECYTIFLDTAEVKNYYINWWAGDVNLVCSSLQQAQKEVTIRIPMPWNNYSASSSYKPYKIKMAKNENAANAINDPSKLELITNYTWDNNERYVIIKTTDLNAAYVMAAPK